MHTLKINSQDACIKLNKVPEVTIYFWLIKVMCTTVGETAADYLNVNLNFGLTGTSIVTGILLAIALFIQFRTKKYIPIIYWITVMIVSVFGTLVTDNLTDKMGVPLELSTIIFSGFLSATFLIWYYFEKTLSIHAIFTTRRESFYWLAILFTFALGTASGDLMAEGLGLGYATTGFIIAGLILVFIIGWRLKLNHVLSFWMIYILTRPLGASIGDYLSQPHKFGGLGLGATLTSFIFIAGILTLVVFLSVTHKDTIGKHVREEIAEDQNRNGIFQTAIVLILLVTAGITGYHLRQSALQAQTINDQGANSKIIINSSTGDFAEFLNIAEDTLRLLNSNNQSDATKRIGDLEYEWDNAEARLKPKDPTKWKEIDGKIDRVLRELRAVHPNSTTEKAALNTLIMTLK